MPKSAGQKLRVLALQRILLDETDEAHPLSTGELIARLEAAGHSCERKTIYDDIESLRQAGVDVEQQRGPGGGYYVASRAFELAELKLLVDAVQSSKFITAKKSLDLIAKLQGLTSRHAARELSRQVFVLGRPKAANEAIYYNVDALHMAIAERRKVSFQYFDLTVHKARALRRGGERYVVSPVALIWDDENYYLLTYAERHRGFTHYRIDRMLGLEVTAEPREEAPSRFDAAAYTKKVFGMFGGAEERVSLVFHNSLVGAVLDRFGADLSLVPVDGDHFRVTPLCAISPVFLGWLFQFGGAVRVEGPGKLIEALRERAEAFIKAGD